MRSPHTFRYVFSAPNISFFCIHIRLCFIYSKEQTSINGTTLAPEKRNSGSTTLVGLFMSDLVCDHHVTIRHRHGIDGRSYTGVWFPIGDRNMCVVVVVCQVITAQSKRVTPENSSALPATAIVMVREGLLDCLILIASTEMHSTLHLFID